MMTIEDRKKGGLDGGRLGRNWKLRHIRDGGCLVLSRYELGEVQRSIQKWWGTVV